MTHHVPFEVDDRVLCARVRGQGPGLVLEAGGAGLGAGSSAWGCAVEDRLAEGSQC